MRVFVFEYATGGGTLENPDAWKPTDSLLREGSAMLRAVSADLADSPGVEVAVQLDSRLENPTFANCQVHLVNNPQEERASFRRLASAADWTIVIAPEFDGTLARLCQIVEQTGGRLLGPTSEIVALLSDKLATARRLADAGVPSPRTWALNEIDAAVREVRFPAIVKPRFGAGSLDVRLVENWDGAAYSRTDQWLIQDFHCGRAVSVVALCGPKQVELLPAVIQLQSDDGRFRYLGGRMPVSIEDKKRAHRLVRAAIESLPGLKGYVGFDLVLGSASDGSEDVLIEINPRLTTSYVGLRELSRQNLASAMINIVMGKPTELSFSREPLDFSPDGSMRPTSACTTSK